MPMGKEKKMDIISYENLLKGAYHTIKLCLICGVTIEIICLILGLISGHDLSVFLLVGLAPSSIVMLLMCRDIIKVICIMSGFITIRNDEITDIWQRSSGSNYVYFARLEKNGKISLSESEYEDVKQGDKVYVVKYGIIFLKDIYLQSNTRIDQDLMGFYEE